MLNQYSRTELLFGKEALDRLSFAVKKIRNGGLLP